MMPIQLLMILTHIFDLNMYTYIAPLSILEFSKLITFNQIFIFILKYHESIISFALMKDILGLQSLIIKVAYYNFIIRQIFII